MTHKSVLKIYLQQFASELCDALRKFRTDTSGGLSVEFVLVFPLLIWAYISMFSFFHAFRAQGLNLRASYAIADFVTRQTEPMSNRHLQGMLDVFEFMVGTEQNSWIRLTSVHWDEDEDDYDVVWSHATGGHSGWSTQALLNAKEDELPVMARGDYAIIVETSSDYTPIFTYLPLYPTIANATERREVTFENFIFTTNRQTARVCWEFRCNN